MKAIEEKIFQSYFCLSIASIFVNQFLIFVSCCHLQSDFQDQTLQKRTERHKHVDFCFHLSLCCDVLWEYSPVFLCNVFQNIHCLLLLILHQQPPRRLWKESTNTCVIMATGAEGTSCPKEPRTLFGISVSCQVLETSCVWSKMPS